jgi:hypothetical protein
MGRLENLRLALANVDQWIPMDMMPLVAIAQHNGMPTRLLDWSTSHLIATYFAASGALADIGREQETSFPDCRQVKGDLAVWRLDAAMTGPDTSPLRVFYPPYADNANLSAQKGLFTHWESNQVNLDDPADLRPLDALIMGWHPDALLKVQLPRALAPNLLVLLERRGIDAATVFPGYAGGVNAVRETEIAELSLHRSHSIPSDHQTALRTAPAAPSPSPEP